MPTCEYTLQEIIAIDIEARRLERKRVLEIIEQTRQKIYSLNPGFDFPLPKLAGLWDEMVEEIKGDMTSEEIKGRDDGSRS